MLAGAPARLALETVAAELCIEADAVVRRVVDKVLDAVRVDLDCRGYFVDETRAARVKVHPCKIQNKTVFRSVVVYYNSIYSTL